MPKVIAYKVDTLEGVKPDSIIALKVPNENKFELYVSNRQGIPYPLSVSSTSGAITSIVNTDGELNISGGSTVTINISNTLLATINSALQSGDNISELLNDAGYLVSADLPTKTSDLLNDGANTTSTYVETDELGAVAFSNDYNDLINLPVIGLPYSDEEAQDAIGNILTDSSTIDFTYNDATPTITADVKANSITATQLADNINISEFTNDEGYLVATDSDITGKVPYTGATTNVDLGEYQLKAGQLEFDQTPTGTFGVGKMRWNDVDGTAEIMLKGGNVTLQIGQEQLVRVVNKTASNLLESNYQVVYISGAQGQRLKVDLALADSELTSAGTLGVVTEDILINQEGFVTTNGLVRGINTTGILQGEVWNDGDILYLSPTVGGGITNIKTTAPNHIVVVGICIHAHNTQGSIFVKVDNGYELEELHNVFVTTPIDNQGLFYETSSGLWKNKSLQTALGYTPLDSQFAVDINRQGIVDRAETTIAFDGTNTFTITPTVTEWSYYRLGIKHTITGAKTVIITGTPIASGTWYIYIDDIDGTLTASQTVWSLTDGKVPLASINFNDTSTPKYWMADERHGVSIDSFMQYYLHNVDGARSLNTPSLSGYTINTDTNASKTFSITAGTLVDQDYIHNLPLLTDPNGTTTDYVVWYRTSPTTWEWKLSNMPFAYNIGNTNDWIQYDVNGVMTDATGGAGGNIRWINSYLLLTNKEGQARFSVVAGRGIFTSLALAQAESIGTFDWTGFPIAESVIAYQMTWTTVTSTSQGKCRLAVAPILVNISTVTNNSSGAGTDHNTLSNLQGGTIGEYYHVTAAEKTVLQNTSGVNTGDQDLSGKQNLLPNPTTGERASPTNRTLAYNRGTILFHEVKWFTPSSTVSTSGVNVISIDTQFTSAMVGALLIIDDEERIIATYTSPTQVTVGVAFSTNYSGVVAGSWGVYSRAIAVTTTDINLINQIGVIIQKNVSNVTDSVIKLYKGSDSSTSCGFTIDELSGAINRFGFIYQYGLGSIIFKGSAVILFSDNKTLFYNNELNLKDTGRFNFSASSDPNGTKDAGIRRNAAGVLEIFDGINANGLEANRRDLYLRTLTAQKIQSTVADDVAVRGISTSSIGVLGYSSNDKGVAGSVQNSGSGVGVYAESLASGARAFIAIVPSTSTVNIAEFIKNAIVQTSISHDGKVTANQYQLFALNTAPSSATDTGTTGEIRYTSDYIYVCVATNTWKRTALTTW